MSRKRGSRMKSTWTPDRLKRLRETFGLSQAKFAPLLRVPIDTLQNWEQGRAVWPPIAEFRFEELEAENVKEPAAASA